MNLLTGTVIRVQTTFSFIQAEEELFFAHEKEFATPGLMQEGRKVRFVPAPTHKGLQAFHIVAA